MLVLFLEDLSVALLFLFFDHQLNHNILWLTQLCLIVATKLEFADVNEGHLLVGFGEHLERDYLLEISFRVVCIDK